MSQTFASLAVPNYRRYASGAIVSNTGTWMQRVAQDWLVLTVLTQHSGVAVGVTTGLQFAPMLLLSPLAGLIADRYPKRRVMLLTQAVAGLLALTLGLLVVTDAVRLWHVYLMAALLGTTTALESPTRQTFVSELVPTDRLANAVGLNSASFHAGRLIGPGLAGLGIAAFGTGPVFLINAVTFGATIAALLSLDVRQLTPAPPVARARGQVREGLRYLRGRADLILILTVVGLVGTFTLNFQLTTALMATQVYGKGAQEYGLLGSIMAVGSLAGALLAARRQQPAMRLLLGASAVLGVTTLIAAVMPSYPLFALALVPIGLSSLTMMTAGNTMVQLSTEPAMRGRVMSVYMAVFLGGTPLGAPIVGWIGEQYGARWTLIIGGVVALACALVAGVALLRLQQRVVVAELGRRPLLRLQPVDLQPARPGAKHAGSRRPRGRRAGVRITRSRQVPRGQRTPLPCRGE